MSLSNIECLGIISKEYGSHLTEDDLDIISRRDYELYQSYLCIKDYYSLDYGLTCEKGKHYTIYNEVEYPRGRGVYIGSEKSYIYGQYLYAYFEPISLADKRKDKINSILLNNL